MARRSRQGFTLVEVMVSLGVMTVGALAIIGMQQQTTRANVHARELTTATQIAQNVIERMKLDAMSWRAVTTAPATDLQNTVWLKSVVGSTPGNFISVTPWPAAAAGATRTLSNAFNYYGEDMVLQGASQALLAQVHYCASFRPTWVYVNFRALRVDVRVWWSKDMPGRAITSDFASCADDNTALNPGGAQYDNYHIVYLSTVIRPTGN
jgi:type IV pilus modification protein PilV